MEEWPLLYIVTIAKIKAADFSLASAIGAETAVNWIDQDLFDPIATNESKSLIAGNCSVRQVLRFG